jgi:hypothetical protein
LAGSIGAVLPASFISVDRLTSIVGGIAAAIAIGAFLGQALGTLRPVPDLRRRRLTAVGGFLGLALMSGFIFLSVSRW